MLFCLFQVLFLASVPCLLAQGELDDILIDLSDVVTDLMSKARGEDIRAVCGPHPLSSILDKLEGKMDHEAVVQLLTSIRFKAPRLWRAYENALKKYTTCKLMAAGGTLG